MSQKEKLFSVTKDDFRIEFFRAGGKGGQHQNKTSSACRITHIASGAVGESREHRSQYQNKKTAFNRCVDTNTFKKWLDIETAKMLGLMKTPEELMKEVDETIAQDITNGNIRIEHIKKGE